MPTLNPRITVTLTPGVHATLKRLSEVSGESQSAIVGQFLQEAEPVLVRMVKVLDAAERVKQASAEQRANLAAAVVGDLEQFQGKLERQLGLGLDVLDGNASDLATMAERIERRGGRSGSGGVRTVPDAPKRLPTPMSNRGVTTPSRKGAEQAGSTRKKASRGPL